MAMAANAPIDPEALAAACAAATPGQQEEIEDALAGIDPRYRRGGKSYQYFSHYESDEEERLAREDARLNGVWDPDETFFTAIMQQRGEGGKAPRGSHSSSSRKVQRKVLLMPIRPESFETSATMYVPLVRIFVSGITRGVKEFYGRNPGMARLVGAQVSRYIATGKMPHEAADRRHRKRNHKLVGIEIYGLDEEDAANFRRRPHALRIALTAYALHRDGYRVRRRDCEDEVTATSCEAIESMITSSAEG